MSGQRFITVKHLKVKPMEAIVVFVLFSVLCVKVFFLLFLFLFF